MYNNKIRKNSCNIGPYVVGCTDLMVGPDLDTGCFFRLYYPTALHNAYVIVNDKS